MLESMGFQLAVFHSNSGQLPVPCHRIRELGAAVRLVDIIGNRYGEAVFQNPADLDFVEEDVSSEAMGEFEDQIVVDFKDAMGAAAQELYR